MNGNAPKTQLEGSSKRQTWVLLLAVADKIRQNRIPCMIFIMNSTGTIRVGTLKWL